MVKPLLEFLNPRRFMRPSEQDITDLVDWPLCSRNIKDFNFVIENKEKYPWDWEQMSINKYLNFEVLQNLMRADIKLNSGQYGLSLNPSLGSLIEANPEWGWEWGIGGVSSNSGVGLEFIEKYIDKKNIWFGLGGLSSHPELTAEFILKYPDKDWMFDSGKYSTLKEDPRPN